MKQRKSFFIVTLIIFIIINTCIMFYLSYLKDTIPLPECIILKHTGIYCPACGSTRAVQALYQGKILQSIYFNPFILYVYIILICYMITEGISILAKKENKFISHEISIYIWCGIIILLINWIVKIIMQLNGIMMPI